MGVGMGNSQSMPDQIFTDAQQNEIKRLVHEALTEFFASKGTLTKNVLVTTATIVGSLIIIGGGLKWLLGLFGITLISK